DQALHPRGTIQLKHPRSELETSWIRKHVSEHQPCDPMRRTLFHNLPAHLFHHVSKMHAGRACRFTRATVKAAEHVLDERIRYPRPPFIKRPHQVNATTRRVHLAAKYAIRRT